MVNPWARCARAVIATLVVATALAVPTPAASAATLPSQDPFYRYSGTRPLRDIAPGTVLNHRTVAFHFAGIPLPTSVTQLLYRTTGTQGQPTVTVASVVQPLIKRFARPRLVSYQDEYDANGDQCDPSYGFSGGAGLSSGATEGEQAAMTGYLLSGYSVVVPDYEGTRMHFLSAPESAHGVLDGIRAALRYRPNGFDRSTRVAMVGYSGGSFATAWAAQLQPTYAPGLHRRLVGVAAGGIPVHLMHNLDYVDGTALWSGAIPLALVGLARAYRFDVRSYASDYGRSVLTTVSHQCIVDVLGRYPGLSFAKLMKPAYRDPTRIAAWRRIVNGQILSRRGRPSVPMLMVTANLDGRGDLVIVAGDVRSAARNYCSRGARITFRQYDGMEHVTGFARFVPDALQWIDARFAGKPSTNSCGHIARGNPLTPLS